MWGIIFHVFHDKFPSIQDVFSRPGRSPYHFRRCTLPTWKSWNIFGSRLSAPCSARCPLQGLRLWGKPPSTCHVLSSASSWSGETKAVQQRKRMQNKHSLIDIQRLLQVKSNWTFKKTHSWCTRSRTKAKQSCKSAKRWGKIGCNSFFSCFSLSSSEQLFELLQFTQQIIFFVLSTCL